jgi:hypothetical protein
VVDTAVLGWIEQNILTEEVIGAVLNQVRRRLSERVGGSARGAAVYFSTHSR